MTIGVVILNWNGLELLKQFLPDIINYSPEATIYLADNASTDTSVKFTSEHFPDVKIVENSVNGGYAKGYNDALAHLNEDIFILLNSDVQVTPHWLEPILKIFEEQKEVGAVQPKILDLKNPGSFEYAGAAGGYLDRFAYPYCRGRIFDFKEKDEGQYDDEIEIFWASGACLAVRSTIYNELGGLDEDYFAHQEEIDLCWRIQGSGFKIKYTPNAVVYHLGGGTLNSMNPKKTFYNFRNSLFNIIKNVPKEDIVWVLVGRMILDGVAGLKFLTEGKFSHFTAVLKAHITFYGKIAKMSAKRKKLRKVTDYSSIFSVVYKHFVQGIKKYSDLEGLSEKK